MDILETHAYDQRQRRNMSCVLLLTLLPFFFSAAVYFYLWIPETAPSVFAAAVKSIPVACLAIVVICYNGVRSFWGVAGGLLCSVGGDICLIWPELFLHGMGFFGVAHLLYMTSFLSRHHSSSSACSCVLLSIFLWLIGGGAFAYLLPFIQKQPDASIFVPAVGMYSVLIVTMATLAVRTRHPPTALGSLAFIASDLTLALQVFEVLQPLPVLTAVMMGIYYLAQLLIAIGDITAQSDGLGKRKRM